MMMKSQQKKLKINYYEMKVVTRCEDLSWYKTYGRKEGRVRVKVGVGVRVSFSGIHAYTQLRCSRLISPESHKCHVSQSP